MDENTLPKKSHIGIIVTIVIIILIIGAGFYIWKNYINVDIPVQDVYTPTQNTGNSSTTQTKRPTTAEQDLSSDVTSDTAFDLQSGL